MVSSGIDMSAIYGSSLGQGSSAQSNADGELGATTMQTSENVANPNATVMYAVGLIIVLILMRLAYEFLG